MRSLYVLDKFRIANGVVSKGGALEVPGQFVEFSIQCCLFAYEFSGVVKPNIGSLGCG